MLAPGQAAAAAPPPTGCPLIRPSGLSEEQVDAVVLARVAQALQRPAAQVQREQSFQAQVPTAVGQATALYDFATLAIGEALGFDAARRYQQAAQTLGRPQAQDTLTVAMLQAVARQAYLAGTDVDPPPADPAARYRLGPVRVGAPTAVPGWQLLRCGHDQVAFWREGAADDESITAVVRITALPAWSGVEAFHTHLRSALQATVPAGYALRTLQVQPMTGTPQPCAEARVLARGDNMPFRMRARFCYAAPGATHGSAVMFSHAGSDDVPQFEREAEDFLGQVKTD